uniref:HTH myb-type domain-containing protein n=1 Tax=Oryza nivara TaxID=4536 RepID=A0A0E0INU6_ORYNI
MESTYVYTNEWRKSEGGGRYDGGKSCSKAEQERRKGIPWTEEEHRYVYTHDSGNQDEQLLFVFFLGTQLAPLLDLLRDASESMAAMSCDCDWIVRRLFLLRNFVISRTPTQVASHAQKYFIRLNSMNRDRRRSSIHDITSVTVGDVAAQQGPITGQAKAALRRRSGHRA